MRYVFGGARAGAGAPARSPRGTADIFFFAKVKNGGGEEGWDSIEIKGVSGSGTSRAAYVIRRLTGLFASLLLGLAFLRRGCRWGICCRCAVMNINFGST